MCLEGVFIMSGRCLESVCLEGVWIISCRSSGRCLEVVFKVLEGVCKVFGGCRKATWKVSEKCLKSVWKVAGIHLEGVLKLSGRDLKGAWKASRKCLEYPLFLALLLGLNIL